MVSRNNIWPPYPETRLLRYNLCIHIDEFGGGVVKLFCCVAFIALFGALAEAGYAGAFALQNGFFSVAGKDGVVDSLRVDPAGKSRYGRNQIISLSVGVPVASETVVSKIDKAKHRLTLHGATFRTYTVANHHQASFAQPLEPGHTLGQSFTVAKGVIFAVSAQVPTWNTSDSGLTIKLYRLDGEHRTEVSSIRQDNHIDGKWIELKFSDQPAGKYLLEMSDVKGKAGWWSANRNDIPGGEATIDGTLQPNVSRNLLVYGYHTSSGDFEIALKGNKFQSKFTLDAASQGQALEHRLVMPWVKAGYDTTSDKIPFHHFISDAGLYVPVHQMKRRPFSGIYGQSILMSGRFGADMVFNNGGIHFDFADDKMTMVTGVGTWEMEVLPHTDKLPVGFPVFYSSNAKSDKVLNEFFLSHNFNFGVGTNPDWKEWHTLQIAWTANKQNEWQHQQFLDFKIAPDGYVYCWGGDPGWPFPFKDDDKDGKNDYDTRHFTTNPCFVLGGWREYCWTRETDYLAKLMPRVRLAMEFMLKELDGTSGMLTIKAPGHEGKDGSIGSNYWDILPMGYKDAFTDAHFYPCLEAMAQLEEAVLANAGVKSKLAATEPVARTPRFYRELAQKARKAYNDTFWLADKGRYSGCVDIDGVTHDYGHTFVNLPAMAYGLADPDQVKRIYNWMETAVSASGKADMYSRWIIAPRAGMIHNPKRTEPQTLVPSWWSMSWAGTDYDEQCQDGGAILYTSYHDIMARAKYLGADNAWKRLTEILDRYSKPDHLSGGCPLYLVEITQGGPGGVAGAVGVEGEFPESGLVPVSFLYAFLGIDADVDGLKIRPNLPKSLSFGGVRNLRYNGKMYDIKVTNDSVRIKCTTKGAEKTSVKKLKPGEAFRLKS